MGIGLIVSVIAIAVLVNFSIVSVPEGHVAVFYRGGALLNMISPSGFVFRIPLLTAVAFVQVTMQTDEVVDIPCGTRGGVLLQFEKIEVVNQLDVNHVINTTRWYGLDYDKTWIFDKIHHEINQFCSSHSLQEVYIDQFDLIDESLQSTLQQDCKKYDTGISIIAVRVTKPKIPETVKQNYEKRVKEITELLVTKEIQKVVEHEAETESLRAKILAEMQAEVSHINKARELMENEAAMNMSQINDEIQSAHQRTLANADAYRLQTESDAFKELLTHQYLSLLQIQALTEKNLVVFGNSIPSFLPNDILAHLKK